MARKMIFFVLTILLIVNHVQSASVGKADQKNASKSQEASTDIAKDGPLLHVVHRGDRGDIAEAVNKPANKNQEVAKDGSLVERVAAHIHRAGEAVLHPGSEHKVASKNQEVTKKVSKDLAERVVAHGDDGETEEIALHQGSGSKVIFKKMGASKEVSKNGSLDEKVDAHEHRGDIEEPTHHREKRGHGHHGHGHRHHGHGHGHGR